MEFPEATDEELGAGFAEAKDVESHEIYHPAERPGYACWTALWNGPEGSTYLAFAEKRRGLNTLWEPVPLGFWESMNLPVNYHTSFCNGSRDVITEMVVLESCDAGGTWAQIGRSPSKVINIFAWEGLADGSIMRVLSNDYVAFDPSCQPRLQAQVSGDRGNTWTTRSILMEGYQTYPYRLKRLSDGTLVLLLEYQAGFGPGRIRRCRHTKRPYVHREETFALFFSADEGRSWVGPQTVFAGEHAPEADFVELPGGDLLFVNSVMQGGPQLRQKFLRTERGFVPGPVFDVVAGVSPECLVLTRSGLLIGANRFCKGYGGRAGIYTCSNDEGATWYKIGGLPPCNYQPRIIELSDGRVLCTWHIGGDNFFGEADQWVGAHTFRLVADLPRPTKLSIEREKNPEKTRYVNAYTAKLTCGGAPLRDREVHFAYHLRNTQDYDQAADPRERGTVASRVTDDKGRARLDLSELDEHTHPHQSYRVTTWFEPDTDAGRLASARSEIYFAYTATMDVRDLNEGA